MDYNSQNENMHIQVIFTEKDFEFKHFKKDNLPSHEKEYYDEHSNDKGLFVFELAFSKLKDLSQSVAFLRYIANEFVSAVISDPGFNLNAFPQSVQLCEQVTNLIVKSVPYAIGSEYVSNQWVDRIVALLNRAYISSCSLSGVKPSEFIASKRKETGIPSRIYFHLVENKQRDQYPFAFLATYTTLINGGVSHAPLKNALSELHGKPYELDNLIKNIHAVANVSAFVKHLLETGDIFYPIKFTNDEAYRFLKEVSLYEKYGIICRIPQWYNSRDNVIRVNFDEKKQVQPVFFSRFTINKFAPEMVYQGVRITVEEARALLSKKEGLEQLKGRWVEVNHQQLLELLNDYESLVNDGTSLIDIIKNRSGLGLGVQKKQNVAIEFSREDFVAEFIKRAVATYTSVPVPKPFDSILRQYQSEAFSWLYALKQLGMGACLADDMGLGKTIEVLSFLKQLQLEGAKRVLVIVPATLVDNWKHEIAKFAPEIGTFVLRGSNQKNAESDGSFLTICTYQMAVRSDYIEQVDWDAVVLDEAQAIKNYYTAQAQKVKMLKSNMRIVMTGTPIENNLLELWSIFDFVNPGLLGTRQEFLALHSRLLSNPEGYKDIKTLINPFVLRRVKTDKRIISDLPEKNEIDVAITLTKQQIVLYKKVVEGMNAAVRRLNSRRDERIIVLTSLMKLKQVCNHPSQYYGDDNYDLSLSGKFIELKHICETISEKDERVIVFTQFREIIPALVSLLEGVFGAKGLSIDGNTAMKNRDEYVQAFQTGRFPFMVLSLKTGGVGLNLTAAQNVIHFDRWWNPAVENQATDRAYRIGQSKNVTVYKLIAANTIEERIAQMLAAKQSLSDQIINDLDDNVLRKLSTEEMLAAAQYGGVWDDEEI